MPPDVDHRDASEQLVSDGTYVYFIADGKIERCAVTGCAGTPTVLASSTGEPCGLTLTGDVVDWTDMFEETVSECSVSVCNDAPAVLIDGQFNPWGLVRRGKAIYWTDNAVGYVLSLALP